MPIRTCALAAICLTTVACGSGNSSKAGYEREFRQLYTGAACSALRVQTGPAKKLCATSEAADACRVYYHDPNDTMGLVTGTLTGLVCQRHGICRDGTVDIVAAAMLDAGTQHWSEPEGAAGEGSVDVARTLTLACTAEGKRQQEVALDLQRSASPPALWNVATQRQVTAASGLPVDIYMIETPAQTSTSSPGTLSVGSDVDGFDSRRTSFDILLAGQRHGADAYLSCAPGPDGLLAVPAPDFVSGVPATPPAGATVQVAFRVTGRDEVGEFCEETFQGGRLGVRRRAHGLTATTVGVRVLGPDRSVVLDWSPM